MTSKVAGSSRVAAAAWLGKHLGGFVDRSQQLGRDGQAVDSPGTVDYAKLSTETLVRIEKDLKEPPKDVSKLSPAARRQYVESLRKVRDEMAHDSSVN